jgi:hypothetical protein
MSIKSVAAVCSLGMAQAAVVIPFAIEITSSPYAAGFGAWSLNGPTSTTQGWAVDAGSTYSSGADAVAGEYTWSLSGIAGGIGSISWALSVGA